MRPQRTGKLKFRYWGLLLVVMLIAGLMTPFTLAAPQEDPIVRIGYLGDPESDMVNGAQMAIDEINASGGIEAPDGTVYTFELVRLTGAPPTAETLADNIADLAGRDVAAILGPADNDLLTPENIQALVDTRLPVLTAATSDTLTDADAEEILFRIRAPERVYSNALATYLLEDLELTQVIVVQTDVASTEALVDFEAVLSAAGVTPADRIQVPGGTALAEESQRILNANPEAVAMWGPFQDATVLLRQLREGGWTGRFAYRDAAEAARAGTLPDQLAEGVIGVTAWSYGYPGELSLIFLHDYVTTFGDIPGPLAASAYDAMWYLRTMVRDFGPDAESIQQGLVAGQELNPMQGRLHPSDFGNGDLVRFAMVYELGPYGGPEVVAHFDDTTRLPLPAEGQEVGQVPAGPPTITPTPSNTPVPTATLPGAWATVNANALNVRTGPGFNYDRIGQVTRGDLLRILGATADYSWLTVDFQGGVGWVKTEFVEVSGDLTTVTIVQPPASPTPAASPTASLPAGSDLVIDTVVLNPAQPIPNRPFSATVSVRNAGGAAAGQFAVAATFEPGSVYLSAFVGGLAGGQSTQVQLNGTLTGTGVFQVGVVADLNNEVGELNETNNIYNITYRVDYPTFTQQNGLQMTPTTNWDMYGGIIDFKWDGYNIDMENGAQIGVLSGVTYENVHYDSLSPAVINNAIGIGTDQVNTGIVVGIYTAEGQRAVMRIDNRQGTTMWVSYRVYNNAP